MKKFTGNYSNTEHNFVIQNLPEKKQVAENDLQIIAVLKNIFLRGVPTLPSRKLQDDFDIQFYNQLKHFNNKVPLISTEKQNWFSTIKGDVQNQLFPAKEFYNSIPLLFPEFSFIQNLILPEALITEIIEEGADNFIDQKVDFYLEPAKLIVEIDGGQHSINPSLDHRRNELFKANNITTIRIKTGDLKNQTAAFHNAISAIKNRLNEFPELKNFYGRKSYSFEETRNKLAPTAALRWQILLLSLLENGDLKFSDKVWRLNFIKSDIKDFIISSVEDLLNWISHLFELHNREFQKPSLKISEIESFQERSINIDFSILKRWTDENLNALTTIFVRTDYFQSKNYFQVSSSNPVQYSLTESNHNATLQFFLQNIFNKEDFREGQLSIICNALNRNDTIGLLPTGAGKSICYQLSSILQPGVSFIISPLKSLMFDQKENLDAAFITNTNYISSDQTAAEREKIQKEFSKGKYLFIWISPERLQIKTFREYLSAVNSKFKIVYAVIDEVHCLSEWGHDFRTSYLNLARIVRQYCPESKYIGLTATASSRVHKDIKAEFAIDDANIKSLISFDRKELTFIVKKCKSDEKLFYTKQIVEEFQKESNFMNVEGENSKAAIVFTPHVAWNFGCYTLYNEFNKLYPDRVNYFAGSVPKIAGRPVMDDSLFDAYRLEVQRKFRENKFPLLAATKSFGMGIDKPNINLTVHFGISPSIESIYQEAGRAGRHPDKENKAKSKCYILFSDEINNEIKEVIENPTTTFQELFQIQQDFAFKGDDMFRQLFFYTEAFTGPSNELKEIINFTQTHFSPNTKKTIGYSNAKDKTNKEKSIYRLSLLNIVKDYTIDFNRREFEVSFLQKTDESVFNGLHTYISKYDVISKEELMEEVNKLNDTNFTARSLRYLIGWIYDNVAYERRQALKGIADLCREYKNSEDFKRKIIAYFEVNEITFLLQHISEHPNEFDKWFEVFLKRNKNFEVLGYILKDKKETENLKLKLQRFLESYKNNKGLNFISGIVRLFLNEFDDQDGKTRFEQALGDIKKDFAEEDQQIIIDKTLELAAMLDTDGKYNLSFSVLNFFPEYSEKFYNSLGDTNSLGFIVQLHTNRLQKINSQLYGELTGIE